MAIKFLSGLNLSNVTAGSILKLDSNGNIVAATAGTDYATSNLWSTASSNNIYYNSGSVRIGTYQTSVDAAAKLHVFDYQTTDPKLLIEDGNTGDASMQFKISTQSYTMGIDNSDSDKFVLAASSALGTTNVLEISTLGTAAFQSDLLVNGKYYLSNLWNLSAEGASYAKFSNWVRVSNTGFYTTEDVYMDLDDSSSRFVIRGLNNTEHFIANTATNKISIPTWSFEANDITQTASGDNWYNTATVEYNQTGIKLSRSGSGYVSAAPYKLIGSFTASVSFKTSDCTHLGIIFAALPSGADNNNYGVILRNNSTDGTEVRVQKRVGGSQSYPIGATNVTSDCDDGNWHELTVSYNGKHIVVDIDGTNYFNQAWTDTSFTDPGYVGLAIYDGTCQFNDFQVSETPSTTTFEKLQLTASSEPQLVLKNPVSGTGNAVLKFEEGSGSTQNATITFNQGGQNNLTIATGYQSATDENLIHLAPAENIGLTVRGGTGSNDGNVGIGTTSPSEKLEVVGTIQATSAGTATLILRGDSGNIGDTGQLDSTIKMLHDDGNHGILLETRNYAGAQSFEIKSLASGTETSRFLIDQDGTLKVPAYGAGFLTTDANGDVSVDTTSYVDSSGDTMTGDLTIKRGHGDLTFLTLKQEDTSGDLVEQKSFIDFHFIDSNANDYPQVRIGAEVGNNDGSASTTLEEGMGAFVVYTNNATTTNPGSPSDLSERFRVDYQGNLKLSNYTAGLLKTDANGNVSLDTNTYSTASGVADNADAYGSWTVSDGTNTENVTSGTTVAWRGSGATSVSYDAETNQFTISSTNTEYSNATTSAAGLMSSTDKTKLDGIASGAEVNVQADWNEATTTADAYIKNKPTLGTASASAATDFVAVTGDTMTGRLMITKASEHVSQGSISASNAHLDLYNSWESNTDQKGSIITFTDNYYDGSKYVKTLRAAIKGGTDTVGNTADGYLEFYTDSAGANSPNLVLRLDANKNASFYNNVTTAGKLYIGSVDATTTATTALLLGAAGEVKKRALGSNAFSSTSFLSLAGGTVTGQVIFPSASTTKPVLPNGYIARNDNSDTDGTHDIWGISERYYPSNSTDADAWGIQWAGTPNEINFIGAGQKKLSIDLDTAGTVKIDGDVVATQSYVGTAISNLVDSAPAALDTLNELAAALGDDASFSTTMSTALGNRLRIDVNNQSLSSTELANARTNLGLGTAATSASTDFVAVSGDTMTGNLTMSSATPTLKFSINGGENNAGIVWEDGDAGDPSAQAAAIKWDASSNHMRFYNNDEAAERMRINSDGTTTFLGTINASAGIGGLTLANGGISGTNYNITGVNQLEISDPGEGIVFKSGSSGDMTLAIVDDANDNILKFSGTNAKFEVAGSLKHSGLELTTGGAIDQISEFAMTFRLTADTWTDTDISGTDLSTGTYAMQVYVSDFGVGGQHYYEYYSATISWYGDGTNSTAVDEIPMHRAGHAPNAGDIQFRTQRASGTDTHDLMLQVKTNQTYTGNLDNSHGGKIMRFKFRRLM